MVVLTCPRIQFPAKDSVTGSFCAREENIGGKKVLSPPDYFLIQFSLIAALTGLERAECDLSWRILTKRLDNVGLGISRAKQALTHCRRLCFHYR
jgi:hypothetical protein